MSDDPQHRTFANAVGLFGGLGLAICIGVGGAIANPSQPSLSAMAAVAFLMAVWWLTDAVPMAVTALLPLVLFPLLKILPAAKVALCYGDSNVFLYLGGFLVALCLEESGLHRRVALAIVATMGDSPGRVVLGFMIATGGLSMWLSNTATTMMVLPIAISVLLESDRHAANPREHRNFSVALTLSIAYAASIGGIGTLVGTPTNIVFKQVYEERFPTGAGVSFVDWMKVGVPLACIFLFVAWFLLVRVLFPVGRHSLMGGREVIRNLRGELGPMRPAEWRIAIIFLATAALWILREPADGIGWAPWLGLGKLPDHTPQVDDATVAMAMAILCFFVPSAGPASKPLLTWEAAVRVPWGILLLFGGGLALAKGMQATALDALAGQWLGTRLSGMNPLGMIFATAAGMTFFSEITSNIACAQISLPILFSVAKDMGIDPRPLMIAATIAASFGFMMPVATPPNAIVYGTGRLSIRDMARAGFVLNLVGIVFVTLFVWFIKT